MIFIVYIFNNSYHVYCKQYSLYISFCCIQSCKYSRKKFIPSNWGIKGNLKSLPYDKMDKKLKKGIEIVKDVNDALKKVTTLNEVQIKNKLKYGRKIYKTYISPISFYNFIKSKLNDWCTINKPW